MTKINPLYGKWVLPTGYHDLGWLKKQIKRQDPVGDLSRDAARDPDFPKKGIREMYLDYLRIKGACEAARKAFRKAWREYANSAPEER